MWTWTLFSAGITVRPVRSTRAAPAGAATAPFCPTAVIRPSRTTNAPFSIGALASPMISRAPSYTTVPTLPRDCVEAVIDAAHANAAAIPRSLTRPMQHLRATEFERRTRSSLQLRKTRRVRADDDARLHESRVGGRSDLPEPL